jgi:muramoyltetrapeptide carboxypeptidase
MIIPSQLKPGDKISIIAPARKIAPLEIQSAINTFHSWGLEVLLAKNIFSKTHSYLAGSDRERLQDFQSSLDDSTIKAIISARGGYGSTRILDDLNYTSITKNPKWIIGFSDITAVHLKLLSFKIASIHGTMPILFERDDSESSINSLKAILFTGHSEIVSLPNKKNRYGEVTGTVVGGNLSLLIDSLGTTSELDTRDKILVIEEIDEYFYRIDRMLTQLKRAGKLKHIKALVIGHFTDIKDSTLSFGESVEEIILNNIKDYDFPLVFDFPSGHSHPNIAWVQGANATLKVDPSGVLMKFNLSNLDSSSN